MHRWSIGLQYNYTSDDLYLESCAHEQKTQYSTSSMGAATLANKTTLFVMLVHRTERFEAYLSKFIDDFDLFTTVTSCLDA